MKVSVNCKLDNEGAYGFIKPISDIEIVERLLVFRDTEGVKGEKIRYITARIRRPALLCQVYKFSQMLRYVPRDTSLAIGIYEIPHGLLAFLAGKIKRIPVAVCIIGNPGYEKIRRGFRKALMYFMLRRADVVTVTGSRAKEILVDNGVDPEKIYVLPNSFDGNKFAPRPYLKKYDILSLSYLGPEKELDNFLRIIDVIRKKMPTVKVALAGKGPEKEKLQKMIAQLSLGDNVELLGYVPDSVACYNSARVFVLTSMTEGLPRTVIEAMACGIPCVVSRVGDIEDLVKDGENGFVIDDYNNIENFAEKIMLLLTDKKIYDAFSERAVDFVNKNYSQQAATRAWKIILQDVTGVKDV